MTITDAADRADALVPLHERAARWMELGALPSALAIYRQILEQEPNDIEALRALARSESDANSADRSFRKLQAVTTLTVEEYLWWAEWMRRAERFSQAAQLVESARSMAVTPEERLAVAEGFAAVLGVNAVSTIVDLVSFEKDDLAPRVTELMTGLLANVRNRLELEKVAATIARVAPRAGAQLAVDAVDALIDKDRRAEAKSVWEALERPSLSMEDVWLLLPYLWVGGKIAVSEGAAEHAVELYGEALSLGNADILRRRSNDEQAKPGHGRRQLTPAELIELRSRLAPLELEYVNVLVDSGRFSQALAEADRWERDDAEVLSLALSAADDNAEDTDESADKPQQEPPDLSTLTLYGVLRHLGRATAQFGLGDNRAALSELVALDHGLDGYAGLKPTALLLGCYVARDAADARDRIHTAFPDLTTRVGDDGTELDETSRRSTTLQWIESHRLWADRDVSFAASSGDLLRQELGRRTNDTKDRSLHALLALYAGQLDRAQALLAELDVNDWRDEFLRAVVALELGETEAAVEHCDTFLDHRPFDIDAELLRAEIERERHDLATARMLAEDIEQRRPGDVDAQLLIADCCFDIARELDAPEDSRVDVALLAEATKRYDAAIVLSNNMQKFLRQETLTDGDPIGSRWLSASAHQYAARRGAACAVRAAVLLEKRRMPPDRTLDRTRKALIAAIVDGPTRRRLRRSVLQNRLARIRRWLRNAALWVGLAGAAFVVLTIVFPQLPVLWPKESAFVVLIALLALALFPSISEISVPGGIGFKRQMVPTLHDFDLQSSELQRTIRTLSARIIPLGPPPTPQGVASGFAAQGASAGKQQPWSGVREAAEGLPTS